MAIDVGLFYYFTQFSPGSEAAVDTFSAYVTLQPGVGSGRRGMAVVVSGLTDESGNVMVPATLPLAWSDDYETPFVKVRPGRGGGRRGGESKGGHGLLSCLPLATVCATGQNEGYCTHFCV